MHVLKDGKKTVKSSIAIDKVEYVANEFSAIINPGEELTLYKYVSVLSSLNNPKDKLSEDVKSRLGHARTEGYDKIFLDHKK